MENNAPLSHTQGSNSAEIEKVKRSFFREGRLVQCPAKMSKRIIAYRIILDAFEMDRSYPEKEVNSIIEDIYDDYCDVRRFFVEMGWMTRQDGIYHRTSLQETEGVDMD